MAQQGHDKFNAGLLHRDDFNGSRCSFPNTGVRLWKSEAASFCATDTQDDTHPGGALFRDDPSTAGWRKESTGSHDSAAKM